MTEIIKPRERAAAVLQNAMEAFITKRLRELFTNKRVNQDVAGVIASSLAGVCALGIKAGFGTKDDFEHQVMKAFRNQLEQDLKRLQGTVQ